MKSLTIATLATLAFLASASGHAFGGNVRPECMTALIYHVECVPGMTYNGNFNHGVMVPLPVPNAAMPWQGQTIESVHAQFPVVINWEFETLSAAALNAQLALIPDLELARFSAAYGMATQDNVTTLLDVSASKMTAGNLARMRTAFGPPVDAAVQAYAPADVAAQYFAWLASTGGPVIPQSHAQRMAQGLRAQTLNGASGGVAVPNDSMTLQEIYNEYLFTEAETQLGAFAKMVIFASERLGWAFTRGYAVGTAFYAFSTWLDPSYGSDLFDAYYAVGLSDFGPIDNVVTGEVIVGEPYVDVGYWDMIDLQP